MDPKIEARFAATAASKTFANLRAYAGLERKSVLDIGCAYGEFLAHFGPGSVGINIEPAEAAYGNARGLSIRQGNIESPEFVSPGSFEAIFANNILEHLYSPHAFLIRMKECLAPGGLLVLGVPCVPKLPFLMRFKKFRGSLASGHINFFTRETLRYTVGHAGWTIERIGGFRLRTAFFDRMLDLVYPHFYVIARPDPDFAYTDKVQKELAERRT